MFTSDSGWNRIIMEGNYKLGEPEAWNSTDLGNSVRDIKMDSNFAMLLCSLVFGISWVTYVTYYNSRLLGYIITKVVNRFLLSQGYFKLGEP